MKSIAIGSFLFQKIVSITLFTENCTGNLFFIGTCLFPRHEQTQTCNSRPMFSQFENIFDYDMLLPVHQKFLSEFHMVCTSRSPKISWQTSVQAWSTLFDFPPQNKYFRGIKIKFAIKQFQTTQSWHLRKKFWKKYFISLKEKYLYLLNDPRYFSVYKQEKDTQNLVEWV